MQQLQNDMNTLLLIIDPQIDFINGSLVVPGAEAAMDSLAEFVSRKGDSYQLIAVTLDQHPFNHSSFKSNGGMWPVHCMAHSVGAAVWPPLLEALRLRNTPTVFLTKGLVTTTEEYSIFANTGSRKRLSDLVAEYDIRRIDLCGLAGDVCVANTLTDGLRLFPKLEWHLLSDFTPSIDGGRTLAELTEKLNVICDRL